MKLKIPDGENFDYVLFTKGDFRELERRIRRFNVAVGIIYVTQSVIILALAYILYHGKT